MLYIPLDFGYQKSLPRKTEDPETHASTSLLAKIVTKP